MIEIRHLGSAGLRLIGEIDRSERVTHAYRSEAGSLVRYDVDWDIPDWYPGEGPHHVQTHIDDLRPVVDMGAVVLGAFSADEPAGIAVIVPRFEGTMAWLAFLHVSRPHRRSGVGGALWNEAVSLAGAAGADSMYVSAIPSGPAVDFYRRQGCEMALEPHPDLLAEEPDDLHLICPL